MKNTGRTYESLVEDVFLQILKQSSVQNIKVEKNVKLPGKSTTHEIDVYWEFLVGTIKYTTVIQAKDWAQRVPQGEILKLKAILEDVPGQPRGVFVTKTGYQSGAVDVAKANGIILYELREPTEEDWEGKIQKITINLTGYMPNARTEVIPDEDWIKAELAKLGEDKISFSLDKMEDELFFKHNDGSVWKSLHDIKQEEIAKIGMQEIHGKQVDIHFPDEKYIDTGNSKMPRIKIKCLHMVISVGVFEHAIEIDGSNVVGYILRNIIDGDETTFDKNAVLRI